MLPLSSPSLSGDDRRALLRLARQAITQAVCNESIVDLPMVAGRLTEPGAAFVTVHCGGRLRGCVGRTDHSLGLAEAVAQCAIGAVSRDTRFRPLEPAELARMSIEISVLSELQPLPLPPQDLEAGKHGVMVRRGELHALLLPQVATERGWSVERLLEETCRKADLDPNAWRDPETQILGFTAEVFSEADLLPQELQRESRSAGPAVATKKWGSA